MKNNNLSNYKEFIYEPSLFRSKWYPIPITILGLYGLYGIIFDRIPKEGWDIWWWSVLLIVSGLTWIWFYFFNGISKWVKKIYVNEEGFITFDVFDRSNKYSWNDLAWIEEANSGLMFIFRNKKYIDIHNLLNNYDSFLALVNKYTVGIQKKPPTIKWF